MFALKVREKSEFRSKAPKRKGFNSSSLLLNKQIYETTNEKTLWNIDDINNRQKKLADYAVKTWLLSTIKLKTPSHH